MSLFGHQQDPVSSLPADAPSASLSPRLSPKSPSEAIKPTMAPPPPPRYKKPRGGLLSTLSGILTLILVLAAGGIIASLVVNRLADEPGPLNADKIVQIPKNTGTSEIAGLLQREGVIAHPTLFEFSAYVGRRRGTLKAGEFLFKARSSLDETIDTLVQGKPVLHNFTIPEGLTSEQIVARLRDNEILSGDVDDLPREGSLLPDTYKFERGMTRQQLIATMQNAQKQALNQIWARRSPELPVKTPQELVTLASIVEKETGKADERGRVASVFVNRMKSRMKLQSDPTIVYGIVGGKGTLGRGILRSEIEKATPYNTYAIEGLPPGPIANPGRAALEAAANPVRTKDVYFVADGTGGHVFAETYEQHLRNVVRWRQVEKARDAAAPAEQIDRAEPALPDTRGESVSSPPGRASAFTQDPEPNFESFPVPQSRRGSSPAPKPGGRQSGQFDPVSPDTPRASRAFDAVEGTARDPLRNRTYDLNSPKTVPGLRP